ncbi:hypothetical protein GBA63_21835 (plasmid) [Rubrobacter tropicus]|uniref:Uncharacterized protein n=1 Tax=Rubrobacter tropicus TaxID=2653851 RepID=A0A6G8QFU1_9ACTN|nr:hypothetical protein [Rubrobacter tropicus]QIN85359.1 hypothetical protein GBA63_21835 [Rubrobacter tropicus]
MPLAGAGLILAVALAHLGTIHERFEEASYLGTLAGLGVAGSAAAALGIIRERRWGWALGAAIAGASLLSYLLPWAAGASGTDGGGLGGLLEPVGVLAGTLEALFLLLWAWNHFAGFGGRGLLLSTAAVLAAAGLATALIFVGFGGSEAPHGPALGTEPAPGAKRG